MSGDSMRWFHQALGVWSSVHREHATIRTSTVCGRTFTPWLWRDDATFQRGAEVPAEAVRCWKCFNPPDRNPGDFVVRSKITPSDYWSNTTGWGSLDGATVFSFQERYGPTDLPLDGEWIPRPPQDVPLPGEVGEVRKLELSLPPVAPIVESFSLTAPRETEHTQTSLFGGSL